MLYNILKIPARLALFFYCRRISINKKEVLQLRGPLLIAANHPNSFLDAIILATIFRCPIYSLARGDAFANKFYSKLLAAMNMLPVYRVSEGVENLEHNYSTFAACQKIFKKSGIVLIFSEGRCINEWHLRTLKKGTARLAISAWQHGIPLKVLPLGINYSSFRTFGKNVILNFGDLINSKDLDIVTSNGKAIIDFNIKLNEQLEKLVIEIEPGNKTTRRKVFFIQQSIIKKIFLFIPSILGWLFHFPLYYSIHLCIRNIAKDHYDSIIIGLLFILYPIYIIALTLLIFFFTKNSFSFLLILVLPFTAWAHLQLKKQI
ncbi:MAG: 1-acyl-sn-glycerol-3-phosphate acyltransferase [Chitinophagaceae bacterium]|nr:1-acyl-sn-glycerol-3-phosphate acyltransferase [Chitinophagaceae bacterium]